VQGGDWRLRFLREMREMHGGALPLQLVPARKILEGALRVLQTVNFFCFECCQL